MNYNKEEIGNSIYQIESKKYYSLLREVHNKIFTFNPERIKAEKNKKRYFNCNVDGIKNLYTFINLLIKLMEGKKSVSGIDYGCGNHYFVHDQRTKLGWDVIGYDVDKKAIQEAKEKYVKSADSYIHLDLLLNKIPKPDKSIDFVFCNAVIQHFSTAETCYVLKEISRVLKTQGILLLIFKRNIKDWIDFSRRNQLKIKILDPQEGKIKIEDNPMKKAIERLDHKVKSTLSRDYLKGLRLFHFFSLQEIISNGEQYALNPLINMKLGNKLIDKAIFTYNSGKHIPTAAIFFQKRSEDT